MRKSAFSFSNLQHSQREPLSMTEINHHSKQPEYINVSSARQDPAVHKGYDPERLYVECGRCGAPVLWEPGRATALMRSVGIDPLELDPSCILVSDGCPMCSGKGPYKVQIYRLSSTPEHLRPHSLGNA